MIVTIKTLQQKTFKVEIDETETVLAFKKKIEEVHGADFPAAALKLIYAGKILNDTQPLSDYKIKENGFVVVMVSRAKAKPPESTASKPTQETTTSGESSATQQTSTSGSETTQPQAQAEATSVTPSAATTTSPPTSSSTTTTTTTSTTPAATATAESASGAGDGGSRTETTDTGSAQQPPQQSSGAGGSGWTQATSVLVTGEEYDAAVANLMAMGFERDQVTRALHASFNNPERAAEYLFSGIPDQVLEQPAPAEGASGDSGGGGGEGDEDEAMSVSGGAPPAGGSSGGEPQPPSQPQEQGQGQPAPVSAQPASRPQQRSQGEGGDNPLHFLRQTREFQTLRQVIQRNPQMLQALLQQIGQNNPQLLQVISQNQQAFIDLLNEPGPSAAGGQIPNPPATGEGGQGAAGQGPPGTGPFGMPLAIQVTPDEKAAIDRLKALGFPEHLVIQAYFACNKNEELAANFLLQQEPDDY